MKKSQFKTGEVLILLVLLAGLLSFRRMNGQVQAENRQLATEIRGQAEPPGLKAEEKERIESEKIEAQRLRRENADLYKLRNQVSQLRGRLRELEAAKDRTGRISNSTPSLAKSEAPFIAKTAWADVGLGNPEATIQTRYWAMSQRQGARYIQCMSSSAIGPGGAPDQVTMQQWWNKVWDRAGALKGYSIVATKQIDDDHFSVDVQEVSDRTAICTTTLARFENDWKVTELHWYFGGGE